MEMCIQQWLRHVSRYGGEPYSAPWTKQEFLRRARTNRRRLGAERAGADGWNVFPKRRVAYDQVLGAAVAAGYVEIRRMMPYGGYEQAIVVTDAGMAQALEWMKPAEAGEFLDTFEQVASGIEDPRACFVDALTVLGAAWSKGPLPSWACRFQDRSRATIWPDAVHLAARIANFAWEGRSAVDVAKTLLGWSQYEQRVGDRLRELVRERFGEGAAVLHVRPTLLSVAAKKDVLFRAEGPDWCIPETELSVARPWPDEWIYAPLVEPQVIGWMVRIPEGARDFRLGLTWSVEGRKVDHILDVTLEEHIEGIYPAHLRSLASLEQACPCCETREDWARVPRLARMVSCGEYPEGKGGFFFKERTSLRAVHPNHLGHQILRVWANG